jgi:8-oxo-dGTP pyrophosphatase MutT (NUDIX family)
MLPSVILSAMHRQPFLQHLELYTSDDPAQRRIKGEMLTFVRNHANCFERSCRKGHVTASCWLLNSAGTHALLMHHVKLGRWVEPGGHCDGNADVLAVALKEAQEESGIKNIRCIQPLIFDLDIHEIPQYRNIEAHQHYDVRFLVQAEGDDTVIQNGESHGLLWVGKEGPLPTREPSVVRMFNKWLALKRDFLPPAHFVR